MIITNAKEYIHPNYYDIWDEEVQENIDRDIEANRKADACISQEDIPPNTEIHVEQISHEFLFGANTFLFDDLKTSENNARYKSTFGALFNAATIPFYWKSLEPEQGKPRYQADSEYIYRRPPTDPVVEFCNENNININGHALIYGMRRWGHPVWMPENRKAMEKYFEGHIAELAERYGDRVQRWDVVNESIDQANRGMMPDDYTFKSFAWAQKYFPETVQFNSNDNNLYNDGSLHRRYVEIVRNLVDRGVRVDNLGIQMHIYSGQSAQEITNGADFLNPAMNYAALKCLSKAERPLHLSEITISAPDNEEKGQTIQAQITRNLYRLWFSHANVMGITWWNLVDGGGAPGEPSYSGIFTEKMQPKLSYHVLDDLINHEWKTNLTVRSDDTGKVLFRGFCGKYRLTWRSADGQSHQVTCDVSKNNRENQQ